jgi:hypothetical protein
VQGPATDWAAESGLGKRLRGYHLFLGLALSFSMRSRDVATIARTSQASRWRYFA